MLITTAWNRGSYRPGLCNTILIYLYVFICGNGIFHCTSYVVKSTYKLVFHSMLWKMHLRH